MKNKLIPVILLVFLLFGCSIVKEPLEFRIAVSGIPENIDPHYADGQEALIISSALFEGLVSYNEVGNDFVPAAADSWEFEADGQLVRFNLAPGLWSDGSRITASQYVDSWQRLLHPSNTSTWAYSLASLVQGAADYHNGAAGFDEVGFRVVDDTTLEIDIAGNWRDLFHLLSYPALSVLPLHIIEKYGQNWTAPENIVINGPFNFDLEADGISLVRNPFYSKSPYLDKVQLCTVDSFEDALFLYNEGQVDWLPDSIFRMEPIGSVDTDEQTNIQLSYGLERHFLLFNAGSGFIKDSRVRKAVSQLIDPFELAEAADTLAETAIHTSGALEAAAALLAEAGFEDVSNLPALRYMYPDSDINRREYQILKKQLKNGIGLTLKGEALDWDTYLKYLYTGNYDIAKCSWEHDVSNPYGIVKQFSSQADFYSTAYANKDVDELIRIAESCVLNGPEHVALLNEAQNIIVADDSVFLPLYANKRFNCIDTDKWSGWNINKQDVHPLRWISTSHDEDF